MGERHCYVDAALASPDNLSRHHAAGRFVESLDPGFPLATIPRSLPRAVDRRRHLGNFPAGQTLVVLAQSAFRRDPLPAISPDWDAPFFY